MWNEDTASALCCSVHPKKTTAAFQEQLRLVNPTTIDMAVCLKRCREIDKIKHTFGVDTKQDYTTVLVLKSRYDTLVRLCSPMR